MSELCETVRWVPVKRQHPDADITVLIHNAEWHGNKACFGYFDGNEWRYENNVAVLPKPTHWAEMLKGPKAT